MEIVKFVAGNYPGCILEAIAARWALDRPRRRGAIRGERRGRGEFARKAGSSGGEMLHHCPVLATETRSHPTAFRERIHRP
jgi:hypothetical protein